MWYQNVNQIRQLTELPMLSASLTSISTSKQLSFSCSIRNEYHICVENTIADENYMSSFWRCYRSR